MAQYRSRWTGEVIDDAVEKAKNITYLTIGVDAEGAFAKAEASYGNSPLYAIKNDSSSRTIYVCSGKTGNQYNFAYSNALGLVTVMLTPTAWQEPIITMYATRERVGNVVAIYENGFTASRNIAKGQYVAWETMLSFGDNILYTADADIATGTRLSANGSGKNLTAVSDGGLNDLKSAIDNVIQSASLAASNSKTFPATVGALIAVARASASVSALYIIDISDTPTRIAGTASGHTVSYSNGSCTVTNTTGSYITVTWASVPTA